MFALVWLQSFLGPKFTMNQQVYSYSDTFYAIYIVYQRLHFSYDHSLFFKKSLQNKFIYWVMQTTHWSDEDNSLNHVYQIIRASFISQQSKHSVAGNFSHLNQHYELYCGFQSLYFIYWLITSDLLKDFNLGVLNVMMDAFPIEDFGFVN